MNPKIAKQAGLIPAGYNNEGEVEYLGTKLQWEIYDRLEKEEELNNNK